MKGGRPGTTDWTRLTDAPLPGHYDDFAELARRVALRYPDVKHYIVWNEFKGLWDEGAQNWNVAAYTSLYNEVYDALKAVDPAIRVGGPYLPVEGTGSRHLGKPAAWHTANPVTNRNRKVLRYWLEHKRGADFLVDRGVRDAHDPNAYTAAELFGLTDWFADVVRQIRAMTTLPVWIAEHFMSSAPSGQLQAAWHVAMLRSELLGGAAVALQWEPQGTGSRNEQNLFSDTRKHDGGKPFPAFFAYRAFHRHFPPGTRLYRARASAPSVRALASARMVLLVNTRPTAVSVVIGGAHTRLPGYGVTVVPRP
jgi:hypothetical protein